MKEAKPVPSTFLLDKRVGEAAAKKPFSAQKLARSIADDQALGGAGQPIGEREEVGKSYSFGPGKYDNRGLGLRDYQTETSEQAENHGQQQSKSVRKSRKSRLEQPKTKAHAMFEAQQHVYYVESARAYPEKQSPAVVYQQVAYS